MRSVIHRHYRCIQHCFVSILLANLQRIQSHFLSRKSSLHSVCKELLRSSFPRPTKGGILHTPCCALFSWLKCQDSLENLLGTHSVATLRRKTVFSIGISHRTYSEESSAGISALESTIGTVTTVPKLSREKRNRSQHTLFTTP